MTVGFSSETRMSEGCGIIFFIFLLFHLLSAFEIPNTCVLDFLLAFSMSLPSLAFSPCFHMDIFFWSWSSLILSSGVSNLLIYWVLNLTAIYFSYFYLFVIISNSLSFSILSLIFLYTLTVVILHSMSHLETLFLCCFSIFLSCCFVSFLNFFIEFWTLCVKIFINNLRPRMTLSSSIKDFLKNLFIYLAVRS